MKNLKKRTVTFLIIAALLLALMPSAVFAAGGYTLKYRYVGSNTDIALSIEGLDNSTDVYALQLELEFTGEYPEAAFQADDAAAYNPNNKPLLSDGVTHITLYLVNGDMPLNKGRTLSLGTLSLGQEQGGKTFAGMPKEARLTMLDDDFRALSGANGDTVAVSLTSQSSPSPSYPSSPSAPSTPSSPETPTTPEDPSQGDDTQKPEVSAVPFGDVEADNWFYEAVKYVFDNGMIDGTSKVTFSPYTATTRGMIVTILYRLEGTPSTPLFEFDDVPQEMYYADAVSWGATNEIANGYGDGTFGPDDVITREQFACILYRYAQWKGYDVSVRSDLSDFTDLDEVSGYAVEAMQWANGAGIINGIDSVTLSPQGSALRAEAAAILMRFCENTAK